MKHFVFLLFVASVALNFYYLGVHVCGEPKGLVYSDTIEYVDSIPYYYPVPKDSIVIRYVTEKLPVAGGKEEGFPPLRDSATVMIPLTQKVYEGNQFKAYVSGFNQRLDSVFVYPKTQVVRIRDEPKRFNLGLSAGYGMTPKGFQPYIGLSVTYKLFRF